MRQKFVKLIEISANVAIILVAACLIVVLAKRYVFSTKPTNSRLGASGIVSGTKLSLDGIDWAQNGRTLVVVLQKDCHFCTESAPFYQKLLGATKGRNGVKVIAVLPQTVEDGKQYLKGLDVHISDVRQSPLAKLGVKGTPTLILVDNAGSVRDSWVGKLPSEREAEVLYRLLH